ncbi:MAG: PD-(D/E)XK nuclease family protein [Fibrobacter sp.]|nr:PD-(D/E)XK nuclease family protein [Fibrobacter sp.]
MIRNFENLIKNFSALSPKVIPEYKPTYLELCQYPGNRFEEICSRIFNFFFNPKGVHGFKDLFLVSFFDCLKEDADVGDFDYEFSALEDSTDNQKRIDLTLVLKDRVVCIENKIFAPLYNNLEEYKGYIEKKYRGKKNKYFVVLSLKELGSTEMEKCRKGGFKNVRYNDFFERINNNLGRYIQGCDQRYLSYMLDFIKTIQNKGCFMSDIKEFCETEKYKFYCANEKELDKLVEFVAKMKNEIQVRRNNNILVDFINYAREAMKDEISCWLDNAPGIMHYKSDSNLGVEFCLGISEKSPFGKIRFVVTEWCNWGRGAWEKNKDRIQVAYPGGEFKDIGSKKQYYIDFEISVQDGAIENKEHLVEELLKLDRLLS